MLNKVLIVDDSELVHNIYSLYFNKYKGVRLLKAFNGVEALEFLSAEPDVDLIILDINMPLMDGITFLKVLQRDNIFTGIPIIVISTEGSEEDTLRALKLGAKGYITKPVNAQELRKLINKIILPD
jgi:two-component system, chemotaxis family, chemotaxis protein CheY